MNLLYKYDYYIDKCTYCIGVCSYNMFDYCYCIVEVWLKVTVAIFTDLYCIYHCVRERKNKSVFLGGLQYSYMYLFKHLL